MKLGFQNQKGQVIVMVTMSLIAMCGLMGLAVDLGWSYFVKKSAQSAADSAALAAAQAALDSIGQAGPWACNPPHLTCQATTPCPSILPATPGNNIENGCLYAARNGFTVNGNNNRQNVTLTADVTPPIPPTAPGVVVDYWVTSRVMETIPQLFSAVLGNSMGISSARSTAAIVDRVTAGSLYTLNRENDPGPNGRGVDIDVQGGGDINAQGGVFMSSSANGTGSSGYAGHAGGSATVDGGDILFLRQTGTVDNPGSFLPTPENRSDIPMFFQDPMRDKGQPPAPATLPEIPIANGSISGDCSNPTQLAPGAYFAINPGTGRGTGQPIQISGCVNFVSTGGFGNYVFFGGVSFPSTQTTVTFGPGRYVLAGALPSNPIFSTSNGVVLQDQTPLVNGQSVQNSDAGEIFVFTDLNYPGLQPPPAAIPSNVIQNMRFGNVDLQMGNTSQSLINLHGLNKSSIDLPTGLKPFAPVVFWQDQRNSAILYTSDGNIDTSCQGGSLNTPCLNPDQGIDPNMHFQAHPNLFLYGAVYQPRGASMSFQGHGSVTAPMQLITGTINLQGGPSLNLLPVPNPITRKVAALVE